MVKIAGPRKLKVRATVRSLFPLAKAELVYNGQVAATLPWTENNPSATFEQLLDIKICCCPLPPQGTHLVRLSDMERLNIILRKNGNCADTQFCGCPCNADCDFAAVGNQQGLNTHRTLSAGITSRNVCIVSYHLPGFAVFKRMLNGISLFCEGSALYGRLK